MFAAVTRLINSSSNAAPSKSISRLTIDAMSSALGAYSAISTSIIS